ncbi:hypothetical protein [Streptomyces sp. NPDC127108]|uniref:hypothetical protein n=1 Tax=Streptomyces sp. NPDC127108 TaxID=3345361 RepID=UPI003639F642
MPQDTPARMPGLLSLAQPRREWPGAEPAERLGLIIGDPPRRDLRATAGRRPR